MRVCVLALDDPWRQLDGGTLRTRLLVDAITQSGHDTAVAYLADGGVPRLTGVTLRPIRAKPVGERAWTRPLRTVKKRLLPLPTMRGGMIAGLAEEVRNLEPDVLVVSQLRAAPYVDFVPKAALWLDQADVWSLFLKQEVASRRGLPKFTSKAQLDSIQRAEKIWAGRAAAISAAGYSDREYLHRIARRSVEWLPTAIEPVEVSVDGRHEATAGFLGNFSFWPNRDAFELIRDVWAPRLRRLGWKIVIAGIGSQHLDGRGEVEILGEVGEVGDFYSRIDLALAPLRLGGGVKVKIIEALMYRRPVLASSYALAGFPPDLAQIVTSVDADDPDFTCLEGGVPDAEDAFILADRYFSLKSWHSTVQKILVGLGGHT